MAKVLTAACPRCGERALIDPVNPWRPFCSERCKMIDFGKWANEEFSIPAEEPSPSSDAPEDPQSRH